MDDLQFGTRNKRGDWAPKEPLQIASSWAKPFNLMKFLRFIPEYLFPWNAFHMATALLYWFYVVPPVETLQTLAWSWALWLYAVNAAAIFVMYGSVELFWYVKRKQGTRFKYNGKFPADQPSDVFWFKSQNIDNFLRSFFISIPLWTLVEVIFLYAFAKGYVPWLTWSDNPWYLAALVLLCPVIHEVHFFCIHRLIHTDFLYKWVHSVHHNSVNPSPWSSMSMHPVEGLMYFAVALWVLVLPAHPLIAIHLFTIPAFGAIVGHIGFDRIELPAGASTQPHSYAHYLHHKHFEVNYCDNGSVPLDTWFGSWHDGSAEGERRMQERYAAKVARLNTPKT